MYASVVMAARMRPRDQGDWMLTTTKATESTVATTYIGYLRVSTDEQADSGAGLDAQRAAILSEAERRGWSEVRFIEDAGFSGKDTRRPGLRLALEVLARGEARGLVVGKMDRLSRSLLDFTQIMA